MEHITFGQLVECFCMNDKLTIMEHGSELISCRLGDLHLESYKALSHYIVTNIYWSDGGNVTIDITHRSNLVD